MPAYRLSKWGTEKQFESVVAGRPLSKPFGCNLGSYETPTPLWLTKRPVSRAEGYPSPETCAERENPTVTFNL